MKLDKVLISMSVSFFGLDRELSTIVVYSVLRN